MDLPSAEAATERSIVNNVRYSIFVSCKLARLWQTKRRRVVVDYKLGLSSTNSPTRAYCCHGMLSSLCITECKTMIYFILAHAATFAISLIHCSIAMSPSKPHHSRSPSKQTFWRDVAFKNMPFCLKQVLPPQKRHTKQSRRRCAS